MICLKWRDLDRRGNINLIAFGRVSGGETIGQVSLASDDDDTLAWHVINLWMTEDETREEDAVKMMVMVMKMMKIGRVAVVVVGMR